MSYFLQIDRIRGVSGNTQFPNSNEVLGWTWGSGSNPSGVSGSKETAPINSIHLARRLDDASPAFSAASHNGANLGRATISGVQKKTEWSDSDRLEFSFEDVVVSSYSVSGGDFPVESITLDFATKKHHYGPPEPKVAPGLWNLFERMRFLAIQRAARVAEHQRFL